MKVSFSQGPPLHNTKIIKQPASQHLTSGGSLVARSVVWQVGQKRDSTTVKHFPKTNGCIEFYEIETTHTRDAGGGREGIYKWL